MFDRVAERYDIANDILSLGQDRAWRRLVLEAVAPQAGEIILDLAAGTGTSTVPFVEAGAFVVAADLSLGMLTVGKQRLPQLTFLAGDALHLPFRDASFDAVTITFGLRNVEDTIAALQEMARVTKPGGRLVICEFSSRPGGRSSSSRELPRRGAAQDRRPRLVQSRCIQLSGRVHTGLARSAAAGRDHHLGRLARRGMAQRFRRHRRASPRPDLI